MTNTPIKTHRVFEGVVVSDRGQKTIIVRVDQTLVHPKYGKRVLRSRRYHVHNEQSTVRVGDRIQFTECRPLSRLKRWRILPVSASPSSVTS
ncbi:30S ribosomal protein S17 [Candidatus Uhrbacteria bacterium]|nr:30S ribosomal protein S17 [Candidatus Uhrbacteria bacterium]